MFKRFLYFFTILLFIGSCSLYFYKQSMNDGYLTSYVDYIRGVNMHIKVLHDGRGLDITYNGKDVEHIWRSLVALNIRIEKFEKTEKSIKIYALLENKKPELIIKGSENVLNNIDDAGSKPLVRCVILE